MNPSVNTAKADIRRAMVEFFMAVQDASDVQEALELQQMLGDLAVELGAVEAYALQRADALCGVKGSKPCLVK